MKVQDAAQEGKVSVDGRGVVKHEVYVSPLPASKPEDFERVKGMSCTRDSEAETQTQGTSSISITSARAAAEAVRTC